ncbi:MAG: uracil-xanthine permease [Bacilli bacterium]|nr:uracil-xanthine permease [Bacilli bacterium]
MATQKLVYGVNDRPKFKNLILYAFQLLLAILAATIAVPTIIGLPTQIPSAILGAGVGTLVYILFTKGKSPIVISSSFAFLAAFPTAIAFGYMGILVGGLLSGLVYVIIAIVVKFAGTKWVNKLMPPVIIGPVVALIGLSLAPNAMGDMMAANSTDAFSGYNLIAILCGLVTFIVVVICSVQNKKKSLKLIPFIIGIGAGYLVASIFTAIGHATGVGYLKIINWDPIINNFNNITINSFFSVPKISLVEAIKEAVTGNFDAAIVAANGGVTPSAMTPMGFATIALAFCPIALVAFAEHLADHKNMSSIIDHDLLNDSPGLHRTLLGDGVGTMAGTAIGICPNTSYGEGIACVALTRNASVITSFTTACICILLAFLQPFSVVLQTIPRCVMGGVCLALYGYISVSGLKMFKEVDLDENVNLLTVCSIFVSGIGGLLIQIPYVITGDPQTCKYITIGSIATALLLGIATYNIGRRIVSREKGKVLELNADVKREDFLRVYLKQFSVDKLAKGLLIFGFLHESKDATVLQLSNFLRSDYMLKGCADKELLELIKLFELKGYKKGMKKDKLIALIKKDVQDIESKVLPNVDLSSGK